MSAVGPGILEQLIARVDELERKLAEQVEAKKPPTWITVEAYAHDRSISTSTVYNAIKSGRLEARRFGDGGRAIRVRADVEIGRPLRVEPSGDGTRDPRRWAADQLARVGPRRRREDARPTPAAPTTRGGR